MIKLLTINTWKCDGNYQKRLVALQDQILAINADIIALQESFQTIDNKYNTAYTLANSLNYFHISSQSRKKIRIIDGVANDSYSNVAILSKFPIRKHQVFPLPSSPEDGGRDAIVTEIIIENHRIVVASLHLTHLRNATNLRQLQLKQILNQPFVKDTADIFFICGDFNATLDDESLKEFLLFPYLLTDTFKFRKKSDSIDFTLQAAKRSVKIDHILMMSTNQKTPKIIDTSIVMYDIDAKTGVKPSDHNGVLTIFDFEDVEN
jgi:endonuclease/exonuclease/phosphatase family metal-dependent hydrolase